MRKIPIDINEPLSPGDVILLHFRASGPTWIKAGQVALIEHGLKKREEFTILSTDYLQTDGVIFKVRIEKTNPVLITAAVIVGAILTIGGLAALALGWSYMKAEKIIVPVTISIVAIAAAVIAFLVLVKK